MRNMTKSRVFTLAEEPIEIIAGDTVVIPFEAEQKDDGIINLNAAGTEIVWALAPYAAPDVVVLTKTNADSSEISISASAPNRFFVHLGEEDTSDLENMFTYQVIIKAPDGAISKRLQGYIIIWPHIPY